VHAAAVSACSEGRKRLQPHQVWPWCIGDVSTFLHLLHICTYYTSALTTHLHLRHICTYYTSALTTHLHLLHICTYDTSALTTHLQACLLQARDMLSTCMKYTESTSLRPAYCTHDARLIHLQHKHRHNSCTHYISAGTFSAHKKHDSCARTRRMRFSASLDTTPRSLRFTMWAIWFTLCVCVCACVCLCECACACVCVFMCVYVCVHVCVMHKQV